ncbi:NADPH:quinone reductase [Ascoidea rubescens DSM 1968]|uniref:Probable quinone oxidoreductase n=1 Tax=Ascoidea rubescens DSM 1968 TaxID=1344418 RepID=A0A1D2VNW7_9ASCO|nr:putative quinone oxidoreductase [Ascoidea rubescens DSM 1968]ODV63311.1 putative quinone oxidoreductase [Ascoidea rubescens DSM 1968]
MSTSSFNIPKTNKVVLIRENGGPEVIRYEEDYPIPALNDDEILINNKYAGINFIEAYFRNGLYPCEKPYVLGREASGIVSAAGKNVSGFSVGDKVAYLSPGTFAEFTKINPNINKIIKLPIDSTDQQLKLYGSSLVQGLTTLTFVNEAYNVQPNDYILVHAAAGGCGLLFTQLITNLKHANIIATASTQEKLDLVKSYGAKYLINSSTENIAEKVLEITNGKGVQAVFDGIGKDTFEISLASLARKGTFVSFGNASGAVPPLVINRLSAKNVKILRPTVFGYITDKSEWDLYSSQLIDLIKTNQLKFNITKVYPLKNYRQAAEDLEGRRTTGKLTLKI